MCFSKNVYIHTTTDIHTYIDMYPHVCFPIGDEKPCLGQEMNLLLPGPAAWFHGTCPGGICRDLKRPKLLKGACFKTLCVCCISCCIPTSPSVILQCLVDCFKRSQLLGCQGSTHWLTETELNKFQLLKPSL